MPAKYLCYTLEFREDGTLIPICEMDDDTAATIASIEHETEIDRSTDDDGDGKVTNTRIAKLKVWDKNAALEKAMKHLGLYREDNAQKATPVTINIALIE